MTVIPVIDLMRGQVVRAVRGDRQHYRPIESLLCGSAEPVVVAQVLCEHTAASCLYIADLDALTGGAVQAALIGTLLQALPSIEIWLDAGFARPADVELLKAALGNHAERVVPVFGSESLRSLSDLQACVQPGDTRSILSLDRRDGERLDPARCWEQPALWPQRVIVMTLEQVGANAGPDLSTLSALRDSSPATRFIGAGGIRNATDVQQAAKTGAEAWLVASALHDGRLPRVTA